MYGNYARQLADYRLKSFPKLPIKDIEGLGKVLAMPEWKSYSDNGNVINPAPFYQGNVENNLIFASVNILTTLSETEIDINSDGTFNISKKLFRQLLVIHVRRDNVVSI
jgi:hypothetical protein